MRLANQKHQGDLQHQKDTQNHATKEDVAAIAQGLQEHGKIVGQALADHASKTDEKFGAIAQALSEHSAPTELVRDTTGKLVGVKKGNRLMKINRDANGKIKGSE